MWVVGRVEIVTALADSMMNTAAETASYAVDRMTTLDAALKQFEGAAANLEKLETLWERIYQLQPSGPAFGSPPEYGELCLAFRRVLLSLPAIDGFRVEDRLHDYDEAGQMHLDALEVGEFEAQVSVSRALEEQGVLLREYRFRMQAKRRELVRDRALKLVDEVDQILREVDSLVAGLEINASVPSVPWERLKQAIAELDTLLGEPPRPARWADLQRHLHFGMVGDFLDILKMDWPAVKGSLGPQLYGQYDPVQVDVLDLGAVVSAKPEGPVTTRLDWQTLSDEDFERLMFVLISETGGYENPAWLQQTHAPDRGRDLSVDRVDVDALAGVRRQRVIIQCKHWLSKSIGPGDVNGARGQMELWQPPRVDVLIIATTGRFTADAIAMVEQHNQADRALHIAMWPDSHLERLLAARPHLVGAFRLRRGI